MSSNLDGLAYSGAPAGRFPRTDIFSFIFGDPFCQESDFVPAKQVLLPVDESLPIFVDNKTDRSLSYAQAKEDALTVAANLRLLGLDPESVQTLPETPTCQSPEVAPVVLVQLPNCLAFVPVVFGAFASGLTTSLISPALTASEISWILQNTRPCAIITAKACLGAMREALQAQDDQGFFSQIPMFTVDVATDPYPHSHSSSASPSCNPQTEQNWTNLLTKTQRTETLPRFHLPHPSASTTRTALILWSSGTSGRSKGVLHSHNALVFATASLWHDAADFHLSPGAPSSHHQSWLGYVPFYHVFGLCNILLLTPCTRTTTYIMQAFNLEQVCAAVGKRRVTYLHMAPPVAVMLAKAGVVERYKSGFQSVVAGVTGGAPLGHEVVVAVYNRLGFRIRLGYGLSETCSTSLQRGVGEREMHAAMGDCGLPHWGVELMIAGGGGGACASSKTTKAAKLNTPGEILVRAPCLLSAYLPIGGFGSSQSSQRRQQQKQPDMSITNEALTPDGWFRTGDIGYIDARGKVWITDRLKELIKVRAYQVAPAELEAVLCSSELVADAGVVGVFDHGAQTEWPRAYVVPQESALLSLPREQQEQRKTGLDKLAQEIKSLVEKKTARYKWLRGGVVFVEAIPKSPSGKILRRVIKDGGVKGGVEVVLYEDERRRSGGESRL
ncbi:hypothetical protein BD289DRAFT_461070 [Coniella lustricola]|uniref:4-coumarate-CoA ligase n=1 Tax=Coniella lustricola TaxID=2025994 RepID=A0A2T3A710_9PEZI|nr:hypothetical protein BD289DRAFT_461070 [Coniella lustricola]